VSVYLLDIEGTTTPIDFVAKVLFPYAAEHLSAYLEKHGDEPENLEALRILAEERAAEPLGDAPTAPIDYLQFLIRMDRKSPALKSIQGRIWAQGYASGELKGVVYPDVVAALRRWSDAGVPVYIYSSGSVLAQKLIFGHSDHGDLLPLIAGHFDTAVGAKVDPRSYATIAEKIGVSPGQITFVSDLVRELDAASAAGLGVLWSIRPGNAPAEADYPAITSFDQLD
jgi:enolase-phosphatase E1